MDSPLVSFEQALLSLLQEAHPIAQTETLPLAQAVGRVLAQPIHSPMNVPPVRTSAMDGYAVNCKDFAEGKRNFRISQRIAAGQVGQPFERGTVIRIFTGAPVPEGVDAVVMQEYCIPQEDFVNINYEPKPGEHIRVAGEDVKKGAQVHPKGTRLRPQDVAIIASIGIPTVVVYRKLKAAVLSSGNELIEPGDPLPPGAIYNSNRSMLTALLLNLNCEVDDLGVIPDSLASTRNLLRQAAMQHDLIVTTGGVSVGEEDHIKPAVEAEGHVKVWRIAVKPGKPTAFGRVANTHFAGLPGNPVSSFIAFLLFVRPFILRCQGLQHITPKSYTLRADFDWNDPDTRHEFLRVKLNAKGGLDLSTNRGSSMLVSTVWADGLLDNPPGKKIVRGDQVKFIPFSELLH